MLTEKGFGFFEQHHWPNFRDLVKTAGTSKNYDLIEACQKTGKQGIFMNHSTVFTHGCLFAGPFF